MLALPHGLDRFFPLIVALRAQEWKRQIGEPRDPSTS